MKNLVSSILLAVALVMAGTKAIQAQTKDSLRINVEAIRALDTDVYTVKFSRGKLAEVLIIGDGKADLDLYIYDEQGYRVAEDESYEVDCYVAFVPKRSGTFTIKVVNQSRVASGYLIAAQ